MYKETGTYFSSRSQSFHHHSYVQHTFPTGFLQEELVSVLCDLTTAAVASLGSPIPF